MKKRLKYYVSFNEILGQEQVNNLGAAKLNKIIFVYNQAKTQSTKIPLQLPRLLLIYAVLLTFSL